MWLESNQIESNRLSVDNYFLTQRIQKKTISKYMKNVNEGCEGRGPI